jgi:hypothetical protein
MAEVRSRVRLMEKAEVGFAIRFRVITLVLRLGLALEPECKGKGSGP